MKASEEMTVCVQKFQGGDKEAFEDIYKMSYGYLHTCVIHVVRDEDSAQDVLQDAYMEISRNIGQLRNPEDFLGWAAVIANRKCFALLKKKNRELLTYEDDEAQTDLLENVADDEEFIPESLIQNQEKQRLMRDIIDGLTDMQRFCIIAFYYNELSQEEIAQELGIPVNTVKSHINRAKAKIKDAVVELDEKKGTRIYSLAPFMLLFFGTEAKGCIVPAIPDGLAAKAGSQRVQGSQPDVHEMPDSSETPDPQGESDSPETSGESEITDEPETSGESGRPDESETPDASGRPDEPEKAGIFGKAAGLAAKGKLFALLAVGLIAAVSVVWLVFSNSSGDDAEDDTTSDSYTESIEQSEVAQQETAETTEATEKTIPQLDLRQPETPQGSNLQGILVIDDTFESYGRAYGGSIPVKKDGMWGIVNYERQVIVPFEYDGYNAADKSGNVVMYKSVFTERTSAFGTYTDESREYYLFDNQGNLLYQGEDEVRASGGMYITLHENNNAVVIEYYRLDGTVLVSHEIDYSDARINGFYDGISNFYSQLGTNSDVQISANTPFGPGDNDVAPRIGTVDQEGNLSFRDDPYFYLWWDDVNEELAMLKTQSAGSTVQGNAIGSDTFYGAPLISTMNHGYYVTCSNFFETSYLKIYDAEGNQAAAINYAYISADDNGNVSIGEGIYKDSNAYRGFYVDGAFVWYYGPHMVFVTDEKDVLVDFSKNTNGGQINSAKEIVTAVYDYIAMADENYWLVQSGEKWGYIDHDGSEIAMFQDAGDFVGGYALVMEDGEAWLINEDFEKLESLGQAESVGAAGELYRVTVGEETYLYQMIK